MSVKIRRAVLAFALMTLFYLALLAWADARNDVFSHVSALASAFPTLAGFAIGSYLLRYARWHWLLARAGFRVAPLAGLLGYVAGFAFTATPGKVGELVRIRYFLSDGVPPHRVIALFVYERAFDLLVVLLIGASAAMRFKVFPVLALFVALVILAIALFASNRRRLRRAAAALRSRRLKRLSTLIGTLGQGLSGLAHWMNPLDISVSLVAGVAAWSLTAGAFVWLLERMELAVPSAIAIAIYPLAMLAGAASMMPGGLGSTELAIVTMLVLLQVPPVAATVAAVGIRLGTMWVSILLGFAAMLVLEVRRRQLRNAPSLR